MSYIDLKVRWKDSESQKLQDLGIEDENKWYYKEVRIKLNNIFSIYEYDGFCVVSCIDLLESGLITNVPWSEREVFGLTHQTYK